MNKSSGQDDSGTKLLDYRECRCINGSERKLGQHYRGENPYPTSDKDDEKCANS